MILMSQATLVTYYSSFTNTENKNQRQCWRYANTCYVYGDMNDRQSFRNIFGISNKTISHWLISDSGPSDRQQQKIIDYWCDKIKNQLGA